MFTRRCGKQGATQSAADFEKRIFAVPIAQKCSLVIVVAAVGKLRAKIPTALDPICLSQHPKTKAPATIKPLFLLS